MYYYMQKAKVKTFFRDAKIGRPEGTTVERLRKAPFLLLAKVAYGSIPKRLRARPGVRARARQKTKSRGNRTFTPGLSS